MVTTSDYLRRCLEEPVGDDVPEMVRLGTTLSPDILRWLGNVIITQFSGVHHHGNATRIRTDDPQDLPATVDDALSRLLIQRTPAMVKRLMQFDQLVTEDEFADEVAIYFQQAMLCYVFHLPTAAIALGRACLEQALLDALNPGLIGAQPTLDTLLNAASHSKKLSGGSLAMAGEVQRIGNRVMHRQPCTDEQALDALVKVREVVRALYGDAERDAT